jgi:hemerythrin superfamily protein
MRPAQDLLHVLARDHRRLDQRARILLTEPDRCTEQAVAGFATDVLAHEASEQLLLHPLVTERLAGGARLARHRTEEEGAIERHLQAALREPPASAAFSARFAAFHAAFVEHADREELEVFPPLRHVVDRRELRELGRAYATLAVRLPTQLRWVVGGSETIGAAGRRVLAQMREVAGDILRELEDTMVITLTDPAAAVTPGSTPSGGMRGLAGRA